MTSIGAAVLALLPLAAASEAQLYFEQLTIARAGGRPAGPGVVSRVWCAGRKLRLEAGDAGAGHALILRLDRGKAYRLDPDSRSVTELDAVRLRARAQLDAAMAGDLMGASPEGARSSPLPGERTISGHRCRGFRIAAGSTILHVYVASDVPGGVEAFTEFLEWSGAGVSLGGLFEEIRRLPGFPFETRSRVNVLGVDHETVSTVTRLVVGPQPAEFFEPPPGWAVVREAAPTP
jgi:hypothetical protein